MNIGDMGLVSMIRWVGAGALEIVATRLSFLVYFNGMTRLHHIVFDL